MLGSKVLCPYCFEPFKLSDSHYRCANETPGACVAVDDRMNAVWGDGATQPRAFVPETFERRGPFGALSGDVRKALCPKCATPSAQRICPNCHMGIPLDYGQATPRLYAIVGMTKSGKSHFITSMIRALGENSRDLGLSIVPADDDVAKRFDTAYADPVYRRKKVLTGTARANQDVRTRKPLVYSCVPLETRGRNRSVLSFYDIAGEDMSSEAAIKRFGKYAYLADGLIFVLDGELLSEDREAASMTLDANATILLSLIHISEPTRPY